MLIIDKRKDYYDYLQGIYGVDKKIVLDRREFDKFDPSTYYYAVGYNLLICGKRIDFAYTKKGEFLYLDELKERFSKYPHDKDKVSIDKWNQVYTKIVTLKEDVNRKHNCPIMISNTDRNDYYKYPMLKDIHFQKIMQPKDIYLLLSDWLSPKDNIVDTRTNKEKILSQGFDLKTSFRKL